MTGVFSLRNLGIALVMSVVLLLLSFVLIAGDSQTQAFSNEVLESVFSTSITGSRFMWNSIWFGVTLVLLHLGFGVVCWVLGSLSGAGAVPAGHPEEARNIRLHVMLWFLFLTVALLAFNCANFPRSSMGSRYAEVATREFLGIRLGSWLAYLIFAAVGAASLNGLVRRWRHGWRPRRSHGFSAAVLLLAVTGAMAGWSLLNFTRNSSDRPNIVLIGIDSLRTDMVGEHAPPGGMPHIREFLNGSVWFVDTTTPLARTFPSVMSLMSGRQPHATGAYMNLPPRDFIKEGDTLSKILRRAGYRAVFAMDEVRFANFDTSYGFDQVITPPPGATEFAQGLVADTPLSNFVMNSMLGKVLFPHVHANRGAGATYNPDSFVKRVARETDFSGPLMFHTHLTLGHWPYSWADAPLPKPKTNSTWPDYYLNVMQRVDRQFADIMSILRARGVLDNAIVVVYSDHGESFGKPSEALVPSDGLAAALGAKPRWGHGSTVFSLHQYKVVLGMRGFGPASSLLPASKQVTTPATLMDVTPTLAQILGTPTSQPFDGLSLVPLMAADAQVPPQFQHRVRFTETEYNPVGVASEEGDMDMDAVAEAAKLYTIDHDTDRVMVRHAVANHMLYIRQYAAIGDELMLAALPYGMEGLSHQFVVFSKSGARPWLMDGPPNDQDPEDLHRIWKAMQVQWQGIIPTGEALSQSVAKSAVAHSGQSSTQNVTK